MGTRLNDRSYEFALGLVKAGKVALSGAHLGALERTLHTL
jgi:hypothetical protein